MVGQICWEFIHNKEAFSSLLSSLNIQNPDSLNTEVTFGFLLGVRSAYGIACMWKLEEPFHSFCHVGSRAQTQVDGPGDKHPYPLSQATEVPEEERSFCLLAWPGLCICFLALWQSPAYALFLLPRAPSQKYWLLYTDRLIGLLHVFSFPVYQGGQGFQVLSSLVEITGPKVKKLSETTLPLPNFRLRLCNETALSASTVS